MKRKALVFAVIISSVLMLSGCGSTKNINSPGKNNNYEQVTPSGEKATDNAGNSTTETPVENADSILSQVKNMSLDDKIGQMVIVGVDSYTNDEHSTQLIDQYHVGGFILLGQNVKNLQQNLSLLNSLKAENSKSGNQIPLFLGVDQEGGIIDRMPKEINRLPNSMTIGKAGSSDLAYSMGKILGEESKALGYNIDFAPVLDINNNPHNPVIGERAFGTEPKVVTTMGMETLKGIRAENIITSVKHFPGHGDTSVDSHSGLPIVYNDLDELRRFELLPFEEAVNNDVDMVMVAHILFPKIDADNPASMSKKIITDLLRGEMKYKGIVITDDMTMGAIVKKYDIGEAAVKSVKAGSNIILVCHDFDKETRVINSLKSAVENGQIPMLQVDDSVAKVLELKQKYKLSDEKIQSVDVNSINAEIISTLDKYLK